MCDAIKTDFQRKREEAHPEQQIGHRKISVIYPVKSTLSTVQFCCRKLRTVENAVEAVIRCWPVSQIRFMHMSYEYKHSGLCIINRRAARSTSVEVRTTSTTTTRTMT